MYRSVILHVSLAEYIIVLICLACGLFVTFVAEEEGEPQGPPCCETCFGFDD